jgi:photosystem II stability/assembly factor-like uncharacterized protein
MVYQVCLTWGLMLSMTVSSLGQIEKLEMTGSSPDSRLMVAASLPYSDIVSKGRNDASLNDIVVIGEDRLMAVGDRGVILSTSNSGRTWQPVDSPTTVTLHAIRFSSSGIGLAVGGWIGSDTRSSHAAILQSTDAGRSWKVVPAAGLPRLVGVHMQANRCIAWGDYSPQWRTSLFESLDHGLTWRAMPAPLGHASSAAVSGAGELLVVDKLGRSVLMNSSLAQVTTSLDPIQTYLTDPNRPLQTMLHSGERWLACGAKGEFIASADGLHWSNLPLPLSPAARQLCQWRAMEQVGDHIWVCGSPGSIILHSTNRGAVWQLQRTGQTLPLNSIRFVDQNRGWAVGPMGCILATRDGGQSWYPQRARATRLGVLALGNSLRHVPWGPLAAAAWDEQIAVAACVYQPLDPVEQANFIATPESTVASAATAVGLVVCDTTPLEENSDARLVERGVLDLLIWRPDVLLISQDLDQAEPRQPEITGSALSMLKLSAAPQSFFSEELSLPPWNVSKIVSTCEPDTSQFSEQSGRVLRQPGIAIWDCLLPLSHADRQSAQRLEMRTAYAHSQSKSAYASLLGGIAPNTESARQVEIRNIGNYQLLMGRVHRTQALQQLAQEPLVNKPLEYWSNDLNFLLQTVPEQETGPLLQQLASNLNIGQHWDKRRAVYRRLIQLSPESEGANWGRLELLRLERSQERFAWQQQSRGNSDSLSPVPNGTSLASGQPAAWAVRPAANYEPWSVSPFGLAASVNTATDNGLPSQVVPASALSPIVGTTTNLTVSEMASTTWQQLLEDTRLHDPSMLTRPDVHLLLSYPDRWRALQATGSPLELTQLQGLQQAAQLIGWSQVATQELALANGQASQLRWTGTASFVAQPPLLDGALHDACWQLSKSMKLTSLNDSQPGAEALPDTTVLWAYDQQYLYVAIDCPHQPTLSPVAIAQRRNYDADLRHVDHVQLLLDTDRDYCTAIELAVSADGRTFDRCCGYAQYNPKWHVSVASTTDKWTAELAIALTELTCQPQVSGNAWAVSARRPHPQGTPQSWSQLRSHHPNLHAAGLLLFDPGH